MRITTTFATAALALVATSAQALDRASTSHLEHIAHAGLGKRVAVPDVAGVAQASAFAGHARRHGHSARHGEARRHVNARQAAERAGYKPVSELTSGAFPKFYPGLGAVYVRPATLPVGPFLAFDRKDAQVGTIYMLSLDEMNSHRKFDATGTRQPRVDHVNVYYHGGHPGVDFPHYHYVLWHVGKKGEARVAK